MYIMYMSIPDAIDIRERAERRIGQLIEAQKETVGLASGGQPYQSTGSGRDPVERQPTLDDAGIDKHLADRARKLGWLSDEEFAARARNWRR